MNPNQAHHSNRFAMRRSALLITLLAFVPIAAAQYRLPENGNLLDASPSLSGRSNDYAQPTSPMMIGNLGASGNLRYGQSLRSFAPINDPTAFQATLGSSGLSSFVRDSASVGDLYYGAGGGYPQAYYDPSGTAPNSAFLQQTGAYGSSIPQFGSSYSSQTLPGQLNYSSPYGAEINASAPWSQQPSPFATPASRELSSSLFGPLSSSVPGPVSFDVPEYQRPNGFSPYPSPDQTAANAGPDWSMSAALDFQLPSATLEPASSVESVVSGSMTDLLSRRAMENMMNEPSAFDAELDETADTSAFRPGADVFSDLQMAMELKDDPGAEWFKDLQAAIASGSSEAEAIEADAAEQGQAFVDEVLGSPLTTFAGNDDSELNDDILEAESLMHHGRFIDAANAYERARQSEPTNPLPLIGKGNALLAAGQYRSSVISLLRGLERYPELSRVDLDLTSLLGGGETVDIRRSELMKMLAANEDPRLRFLLGYLEYYTGNRESGLKNFDRAADKSPFGSFIRRYPEILRGEGVLPVPKLPANEPTPLDDSN